MANKHNQPSFQQLVAQYVSDMKNYGHLKPGTINNYKTWLIAIDNWNNGDSVKWIEKALKAKNIIQDIENSFNKLNSSKPVGKSKTDYLSSYKSFAKWLIGYYHANIWLSLDTQTDLNFCRLIAENALFCSYDVAQEVKKGTMGGENNKRNRYYSWYNCLYQRKKNGQTKGTTVIGSNVIYDDNTMANVAIKNAVKLSLPHLKCVDFKDYMACHIWDKTCYDSRFHTSVFNLVLVPKAIAGLTDFNDAVKEMLQYESALRFGVYPNVNGIKAPTKPVNYDKVIIWRQQKEHDAAIKRHKNSHSKFIGL